MISMVYGDVSGGNDAGVLSAGCYLGTEDEWLNAIAAWSRALDDAGVDEFHATDFYSSKGQFDNDKWRREVPGRGMVVGGSLHDSFAERFTAIPVNYGLVGFALSLDLSAFNSILAPEYLKEKREHRQDARIHAIMGSLALQAPFFSKSHYFVRDSIQVIFERESGAGRFMSFFDESKARKERWTWWYKSFTIAPKSFVPLQMADLLAHETWRRVKELWSPSPRPIRKSFERMLADGRIKYATLDRAQCTKNADQLRDLFSRYPDGLMTPEEAKAFYGWSDAEAKEFSSLAPPEEFGGASAASSSFAHSFSPP